MTLSSNMPSYPRTLTLTALLLLATLPCAAQTGAENGEWRSYAADTRGTKYAPLDQITAENFEVFVTSILGSLASFMSTMGAVLLFLVFIILEEKTLPDRFRAAFPDSIGRIENIVSNSSDSISTYVISKATCSAGQAIVLAFLLSPLVFDIPGWFLFGTLCFLLDFVPVLGALLATIPPVIIAFIVLEPGMAVAMAIALLANQQLFGSIIEPNLSGQRLGISPLVLLLTVMVSAQVLSLIHI